MGLNMQLAVSEDIPGLDLLRVVLQVAKRGTAGLRGVPSVQRGVNAPCLDSPDVSSLES